MKAFVVWLVILKSFIVHSSDLNLNVPFFLFSNDTLLNGKNTYIGETINEQDILSITEIVRNRDIMGDKMGILSNNRKMIYNEIICIFLLDNARTDLVSSNLSFLRNIVANTVTSVIFPYTIRKSSNSFNKMLNFNSKKGKMNIKKLIELDSFLNNKRMGQTDVLFLKVTKDNIQEDIHKAIHIINLKTDEQATFGLTALKATALKKIDTNSFMHNLSKDYSYTVRILKENDTIPVKSDSTVNNFIICPTGYYISTYTGLPYCFSHYVNITPGIISGIFIGFFFIIVTIIGLTCLNGIQCPTKYPSIHPPLGKEY